MINVPDCVAFNAAAVAFSTILLEVWLVSPALNPIAIALAPCPTEPAFVPIAIVLEPVARCPAWYPTAIPNVLVLLEPASIPIKILDALLAVARTPANAPIAIVPGPTPLQPA